jgi:hypothetical protein
MLYMLGMSEAVTGAQLALARALMALDKAKGTDREDAARKQVKVAEEQLALAEANPIGEDQQQCCGRPMFWANGGWQCAIGHD